MSRWTSDIDLRGFLIYPEAIRDNIRDEFTEAKRLPFFDCVFERNKHNKRRQYNAEQDKQEI